jgi:hypothetical protein
LELNDWQSSGAVCDCERAQRRAIAVIQPVFKITLALDGSKPSYLKAAGGASDLRDEILI